MPIQYVVIRSFNHRSADGKEVFFTRENAHELASLSHDDLVKLVELGLVSESSVSSDEPEFVTGAHLTGAEREEAMRKATPRYDTPKQLRPGAEPKSALEQPTRQSGSKTRSREG